jgi:NADH-quinone oxidoreductase subunit E
MTQPPSLSANAQLEQRLGAVQLELRKLGSERHTLRARLRREADRLLELESALRAEKELRRHAADEHQAALAGVRSPASEKEHAKDAEIARLNGELARLAAELESARVPAAATATASKPSAKAPQGLRRIRGIGPAYQRVLEQLGVTRVEQVAAWTASDVASFAQKLKIRTDRITKDDWVGQAQRLGPEPD